ncbi:unnamed protein product, partial [Rotaria magnacalcarata]
MAQNAYLIVNKKLLFSVGTDNRSVSRNPIGESDPIGFDKIRCRIHSAGFTLKSCKRDILDEYSPFGLHDDSINTAKIFVSIKDKVVRLYNCQRTIHDTTHIGHARFYITSDIIRRVIEKYFSYSALHTIKRAQENYLIKKYMNDNSIGIEKIIEDCQSALNKLFNDCYDILSSFLNFYYLHTIDPLEEKILLDYTKEFDKKLKADMSLLNILPPLTLVHTSAHVRQTIDFIFQLIYYGYAYVSNSSVPMSKKTVCKRSQLLHDKLKLDRLHNITVLCEREEALTTTKFTSEAKKNESDFLLWKKSEP